MQYPTHPEWDDQTFVAMERMNNPARYQATAAGMNPCPCPVCRRLRLAIGAVEDADEERIVDIPADEPDAVEAVKEFFEALGFEVDARVLTPVELGAHEARRELAMNGTRGEAFPTPINSEHAARKATPIAAGVLAYFPDALREVAKVSKVGNDQHNPGQPLHWAREKSTDEADALVRHLSDYLNGVGYDSDDTPHLAKVAWRALALLQRWCDGEYPQGYRP